MKNKNNEEREIVVSHRSDLLTQDLILRGIFLYSKFKDYGASFDFPLIKYEHSTGDISYPIWQLKELGELTLSEEKFRSLINYLDKELTEYKKYIKKFEKEIESPSNIEKKILEYFEKSLKAAGVIPYFAFEQSLKSIFEKQGIPLNAVPSSITYTSMVDDELRKIAFSHEKELKKKGKMSVGLKKDLNAFCNRFGYLGMKYFQGEPWTVKDVYEMLETTEKKQKKPTKPKKKYSSPYIRFASDLLRLRTQNWELMCKGTSLFRKAILNYFPNLKYEKLLNLRIYELLEIIQKRAKLGDLEKRRKSFVLEIKEDEVRLEEKSKVSKKEAINEDLNEIQGISAQLGIVKGKVKIVLSAKESSKVEKGDILVARMSTPDFLPGMRKAVAFVTDIGGITSHAAIVAREMRKPCIIGTKIATQVLKDGMLVEVDANKGIVKILDKRK